MKRRQAIAPIASAASLLALLSLPALAASDSDLAIFGKVPGKDKIFACFTRQYDAAHLAGHPKQNVTEMTLLAQTYQNDSEREYELEVGVRFRHRTKLFQLSGVCDWTADGKAALSCAGCDSSLVPMPYLTKRTALPRDRQGCCR